MSTMTVLKFMQQTAADTTLQHQLEELLGVGDGNISSETEMDAEETAALEERAPVVTEFAAKNGFSFSVDELVTVVEAFHQHQAGELSDAEFATIMGTDVEVIQQQLKNPLQRLSGYLKKTYLGI